ncbi:MAG: YdcF family protein [Spirochaetia bacterium]|nr:YdcF family protein [Spirochaetia bacterium]
MFFIKSGKFKKVYTAVFAGFLFLSTEAGSWLFFQSLENQYPHLLTENLPQSDAIVVLSGMVNPLTGHHERPEFLSSSDRILAGEELLLKKKAPVLLISGGSGLVIQTTEKEADILRRWLIERKHNPEMILAESESKNTAENAIFTAEIAKKNNWKKIILVTSAFHMKRSVLCFQKQNLEVIPFPVDYSSVKGYYGPEFFLPSLDALDLSTTGIKEYIGLVAYSLKGYI